MPSTSKRPHEDESASEHGEDVSEAGPSTAPATREALKTVKKKKKSAPSPGVIYISRIPPGMTPQKIKHLMARWGEVGRVYAQKKDGGSPIGTPGMQLTVAPTGYNPNADKKKQKHAQANYTEAWIEFADKSLAKTVARMLNAEVIGGKKGDRWRDDIWTMRYLSGFKWEMLGEQVGKSHLCCVTSFADE
jgi:ESF2/ABP1 family protein